MNQHDTVKLPWHSAPSWAILAGQSSSGRWHWYSKDMRIEHGYLLAMGPGTQHASVMVAGEPLQTTLRLVDEERIVYRPVMVHWWECGGLVQVETGIKA